MDNTVDQASTSKPLFDPARLPPALQYLKKVEETFGSDSDQYKQFIQALREVAGRGDPPDGPKVPLRDKVEVIFKDHPDMLEEFDSFLKSPLDSKETGNVEQSASKEGEGSVK